jgi:hypothetical protein
LCRAAGNGQENPVETALGILLLLVSLVGAAVVLSAFVWAARKDGEEDRALQRRLGIRRRTRIGR